MPMASFLHASRFARRLARAGFVVAVAITVAQAGPTRAALASVQTMFVFGDSLSDSGNSGVISGNTFPPPPYFDFRFSNGKVAVEYLWEMLHPGSSSFPASLQGGTNYAVGGSSSGLVNSVEKAAYDNKGIAWQLSSFLAADPLYNPASTLFVVRVFPNDVFYYTNSATAGLSVGTYSGGAGSSVPFSALPAIGVSNIVGTIQTLAADGALNFLVVNSPDLSKAPAYRNTPEAGQMQAVSLAFNALLQQEMSGLAAANPQLSITTFDTDSLLTAVLANPSAYGFTNVEDACFANGTVCATPSDYLYWDRLHPTTRGHYLFAQGMARSLAVPGPLPIGGALAVFAWSRKLRQRCRPHGHGEG
jgi:phospholipase/lecithinase/hemolysin